MMKELVVKAAIQVGQPAERVFEAIVNPDEMKNYFISKSSGRLVRDTTVYWQFPEFPVDSPVRVKEEEPCSLIRFAWDSSSGEELLVEIRLEAGKNGTTVVHIQESGMPNNEAGLAWLVGNTEGWANFLACLKAWLEYGVNLRRGAFDFMIEGKDQ